MTPSMKLHKKEKKSESGYCPEEIRIVRIEESEKKIIEKIEDVREVLNEIVKAVSKLAVLEEKYSNFEEKYNNTMETIKRVFTKLDVHDERLKDLENSLPLLSLTSSWVFKAALALLGLLGTVAAGIVIKSIF